MDWKFAPRDAVLRNGRSVLLRPLGPADEAELLQAFEHLGAEARYRRFMRAVSEPNVERLRKVLQSLPDMGLSIAATVPAPDGIDVVASASYVIGQDRRTCEFAITVTDEWAGAGLGGILMEAIIASARARGLAEMEGFVLADNTAMLRLASRLGFSTARHPEDFTLRVCRLALAAPP